MKPVLETIFGRDINGILDRKDITLTFAANVTYAGLTYNTRLTVIYRHTGLQYVKRGKITRHTSNIDLAKEYKGKVEITSGYYYMYRLAIPNGNDIWYINNCGDEYTINKVSKYGRKLHAELSKETLIGYLIK